MSHQILSHRKQAILAATLASLMLPELASATVPVYTVFDLGTVNGVASMATAINEQNQVTGELIMPADPSRAFFFDGNQTIDLGTLTGSGSIGRGINDLGQVVGRWITPAGNDSSFRYDSLTMSMVDLSATFPGSNGADDINNSGQIVGTYFPIPFAPRAVGYISANGTITNSFVLRPNSNGIYTSAINESGHVTGYDYALNSDLAFFYNGVFARPLGSLGGSFTYGHDINDSDQITGLSYNSTNSGFTAFLWENNVMSDLGTLPGKLNSVGWAINNSGTVVGAADNTAFVYHGTTLYNLNDLAAANMGGFQELQVARDINNAGNIVGWGIKDGQMRAFLATLVPPPAPKKFWNGTSWAQYSDDSNWLDDAGQPTSAPTLLDEVNFNNSGLGLFFVSLGSTEAQARSIVVQAGSPNLFGSVLTVADGITINPGTQLGLQQLTGDCGSIVNDGNLFTAFSTVVADRITGSGSAYILTSTLTCQEISNGGTFSIESFSGPAAVNAIFTNNGSLNLQSTTAQPITMGGPVVNAAGGRISFLFNNTQLEVTFVDGLTNAGSIQIFANTTISGGPIVSTGDINANGTVTWNATLQLDGSYISPSVTNTFTDLSIGVDGYIDGATAARFNIRGNLQSLSTSPFWNVGSCRLAFTGNGLQTFSAKESIAWGVLDIGNDSTVELRPQDTSAAAFAFATITGKGGLQLAAGAQLTMTSSRQILTLGSLQIDPLASLNLGNSDLIIDYSGPSSISSLIQQYVGGLIHFIANDGFGLPTYLAMAEAADLGITEFRSFAVDDTAIIVKFTYVGDANLDGQVDALDYERIDLAIGNTGVLGTAQGDLNYDGNVDALDYEQVDLNIGNGVGSPLAGIESGRFIPEPTGLGVVITAACLLARRKDRRA